ncbi:MAG: ACP S-malonyltransferase [Paludibacteraceae bacterium]|nr:ACP S-malonyltransferase [Paludibacteraceae bacterium]
MKAFVFPGQGAQYAGMGKDLYDNSSLARELFEAADSLLGFRITDIMFGDDAEALRQTRVTQPAVFLHSVVAAAVAGEEAGMPDMVAGHSLGEYAALVSNGSLRFEDALILVAKRAEAMQRACELQAGAMAAVLALPDEKVEEICAGIADDTVVAANYNCPGQLVISGTLTAVEKACELLKAAGAKRALMLPVGGAFHSPLMQPAAEELREAILATPFSKPVCPVYQNVNAMPETDPERIKQNLIDQLTAPVRWTQTVRNMIAGGAGEFREFGPGNVLKGLIKKINSDVITL